jgi:hypothetical protein
MITYIIIYLLIGIGLIIYISLSDPYGEMFIHYKWLLIMFLLLYPLIIIKNLIWKGRK